MSALTSLLAVLLVVVALPACAQGEKTITIDFADTPAKQALDQLRSHFGVEIASDDIDGTVNASIQGASISQALTAVVTPLGYRWRKIVIPKAEDEDISAEVLSQLVRRIESIEYTSVAIEDPRENKVTRVVTETAGGTSLEGETAPDGKIYTAVYLVYDPTRKPAPKLKEAAAKTASRSQPGQPLQPPADLQTWLYSADLNQKANTFLEVLRGTILSEMPVREFEQMMMNVGSQMTPLELEQITEFMRESLRRIDEATGG